MTMTYYWITLALMAGVAFDAIGRRLRAAGAAQVDHLRYWWRRRRAVMRGEDPDAWRDEYVEVVIDGIPQNVHPDELALAEHMRAYLADAMGKLDAMAPFEDPSEGQMTMFDQVLELAGGKTAEENPGYRLVVNREHLDAFEAESPGAKCLLDVWPAVTLTVLGYPIRVDESATEMRLEPA